MTQCRKKKPLNAGSHGGIHDCADVRARNPVAILAVLLLGLALAACGGSEDFSDSDAQRLPDRSGEGPASFDPNEPDPSHKTGRLVDELVRNLGYRCGGFEGRTGKVGTDSDRELGLFRCPAESTSIEFFIGGEQGRWTLGEARFRRNVDGQVVDLTPLDLFDSPFRLALEDRNEPRNLAAMLQALDSSESDTEILVPDLAHEVMNLAIGEGLTLTGELVLSFGEFTSADNPRAPAHEFLDLIMEAAEQEEGIDDELISGEFPEKQQVEERLARSARETASGIYVIDIPSFFSNFLVGSIDGESAFLFTDALSRGLSGSSTDELCIPDPLSGPGGDCAFDAIFSPAIYVDRQGNVFGGGPFWGVDLDSEDDVEFDANVLGSGVFMALSRLADLDERLILENFELRGYAANEGIDAEMDVEGRIISDFSYLGESLDELGVNNDFREHYPDTEIVFAPDDEASLEVLNFDPAPTLANSETKQPYFLSRNARFRDLRLDEQKLAEWFPRRLQLTFRHFFCTEGGEVRDVNQCFEGAVDEEELENCPDPEEDPDGFEECFFEVVGDQGPLEVLDQRGENLELVIDEDGVVFVDLSQGQNVCSSDSAAPGEVAVVGILRGLEKAVDSEDDSKERRVARIETFVTGDAADAAELPQFGTRFSMDVDVDTSTLVELERDEDEEGGEVVFADARRDTRTWFDTFSFLEKQRNLEDENPPLDEDPNAALLGILGGVESDDTGCPENS